MRSWPDKTAKPLNLVQIGTPIVNSDGSLADPATIADINLKPMSQDELLGLFSADITGRNVVLEPATTFDMMGRHDVVKPTLEVVYDAA